MIKNKEDIRISTIDRFTNQIFKNAIAPYFNIYNYEIFEKETDEFYSKVLIKIIENEEIVVTYKGKEYIFDGTESILDRFKDVIEKDKNILAIRYRRSFNSTIS